MSSVASVYAFEKVHTTNQISGSTGHDRIVSNPFSDLDFIRHETDGYVKAGNIPSSNNKQLESDSLSGMLGFLFLSPIDIPPDITFTGSKLTVKEEG